MHCLGQCTQLAIALIVTGASTLFVATYGCSLRTDMRLIIVYYLIALNILTAFVYWIDKLCAVNDSWRISVVALFWLTFYGSPIGAIFGMWCICCTHKISKIGFLGIAICLMVFNLIWVAVYLIATSHKSMAKCYE